MNNQECINGHKKPHWTCVECGLEKHIEDISLKRKLVAALENSHRCVEPFGGECEPCELITRMRRLRYENS